MRKPAVIILLVALLLAIPLIACLYRPAPPLVYAQYISMSVTDVGEDGINFGEVAPGTENVGDVAQNGGSSVNITIHEETEVDCNIQIRGSDNFTDGSSHTLLLSNAKWDTDNDVAGATPMSANYITIATSNASIEKIVHVWHWLSIPSDQYAATYTTDFYYQAIEK
jgi:hypothetical protein